MCTKCYLSSTELILEAIEDFIFCYISDLVSEKYYFIIIFKYSGRTLRIVKQYQTQ